MNQDWQQIGSRQYPRGLSPAMRPDSAPPQFPNVATRIEEATGRLEKMTAHALSMVERVNQLADRLHGSRPSVASANKLDQGATRGPAIDSLHAECGLLDGVLQLLNEAISRI